MTARPLARLFVTALLATGLSALLLAPLRVAVHAQSYTVCPSGCPYDSIQDAIDASPPGTTVTISPGTFRESILIRAGVSLVGSGAGATIIQGNGTDAVIKVWGASIRPDTSIENLAVTGGGGRFGAGILVHNAAGITVRSVSIYGNTATEHGGGLAVIENGELMLIDAVVRDNRAPGGSAMFMTNGRATISDSTFSANLASGQAHSGALYVTWNSELVVENSVISGSTANLGAGLRLSNGSTATITGGRFEGNVATANGGAISTNSNATLTLDGVTFSGNRANLGGAVSAEGTVLVVRNCRFERNQAATLGGAVRVASGGSAVVDSSRFVGNAATTMQGGAVYFSATAGEIRYSSFEGNRANSGGAISLLDMTNNALILGNTMVGNQAMDGGGVYGIDGRARLVGNILRGNHADRFGGGLVAVTMTYLTVRNNEITDNDASIDGGGLVLQRQTSGLVEGNLINDNYAGELAGGVKVFDRSSPIFRNNRFEGNVAGWTGGALHFEEQCHSVVENNDFVANEARRFGGAAVAHLSSNPTLRFNSFVGNRADLGAGALYIHEDSRSVVDRNTFDNNWTGGVGGAIFVLDDAASEITNNLLSNNRANDRGGAVFVDTSSMELSGNQILGNWAQSDGGGVMLVNSGAPQVVSNVIADNRAGRDGDGIFIRANALFRNNTVARNDPDQSGDGIFISVAEGISLYNNLVTGNAKGVRSSGVQPRIISNNCFFDNRQADYVRVTPGPDDFSSDPKVTNGPLGSYYLAHSAAGQTNTSPLVDALDQSAQALGLDQLTTRTDGLPDQGRADIGFHYTRLLPHAAFLPMLAVSE